MYISEKEYQAQLKEIARKNASKMRKDKLRKAKKYGLHIKKPSTSHLALWTVIIICVQIIWFAEKVIQETGDTTQLYALVGIPVALVPVLVSYFSKSAKENTAGGIVYDTAMKENTQEEAVG